MDIQQFNEILSSIKNMKFVNLNVLSSRYFAAFIVFRVGFVIGETSIAIAQESQLNDNINRNNLAPIPQFFKY